VSAPPSWRTPPDADNGILGTFQGRGGRAGFGARDGEHIVEHTGDVFASSQPTGFTFAQSDVALLAPCAPSKIVALWNNFHALGAKLGKKAPAHPLFLIKPASSLAGPRDAIRRPSRYEGRIAFEGELGIVIGRQCRDVPLSEVADCIAGYTCVNDVTAVDLMNENADFVQWCRAKGSDTFGCIGPAITTPFDWRSARVVTRVDGVDRQNYPLSDMIFSPDEQVSLLSRDLTLCPGDVIACGTSLGVGSIKDGATVEIEIDGIGTLSNRLTANTVMEATSR
jgi:2-keto-4-pentenoate hydratase/2-oxohepta-3-ene-1,7-dioic acid hydratase in catechol pathway